MVKNFMNIYVLAILLVATGLPGFSNSAFADMEAKLATTDGSDAFVIQNSSDSPLMSIFSDGNVGIGTTSPNYLLDIVSSTSGARLRIKGDGEMASTRAELILDRTSLSRGGGTRIQASVDAAAEWWVGVPYSGGVRTDKFIIGRHASQPEYIANSMFLIDDSGNVGIGTTNPVAKLQVSGGLTIRARTMASTDSYK